MAQNIRNENDEFQVEVVSVSRVTKVVGGGRRFRIRVLVVVGDGKGRVGCGHAKAKEVVDAKVKAINRAKRNLLQINLKENRTFHHDVNGNFGATKVVVRSAPSGTGIKAGSCMRSIFSCLGIKDVVAKCVGSSNRFNLVYSTFNALTSLYSPKTVAERRGLAVGEVIQRRDIMHKKQANNS